MRKLSLSAIGAFLFLFSAHTAYAGFGITPPYVRSDTLTQGSVFSQEIVIVRGDPIEDLKTDVTINVPGINQWITIDKGNSFILPKGTTQFPIKITVTVPPDAEFGAYTGNIRIRTASLKQAESGVSIALGAQVDIDLKVVSEIFNFEVRRVELSEAEEGHRFWWLDYPGKINFWMHLENTGNVPASPSKVKFEIYNNAATTLLETVENTNKIEQVAPFATKKVLATLPTWLKPGGYLIKFSIYKKDEIVKTGELTLSVLPRGTIAGYVGYGIEGLPIEDKLSIVAPIAAPIVLFGSSRIIRPRRRRKSGKGKSSRNDSENSSSGGTERTASSKTDTPARSSHVVDLSRRK
jgi:hypothetical protein